MTTMPNPNPPPPGGPGHQLLRTVTAVVAARRLRAGLAAWVVAFAALALAALLGDALFAWPDDGRALAPLLAVAAAVLLAGVLLWPSRLHPGPAETLGLAEAATDDRWRALASALALEQLPGELAAAGARRMIAGLPIAGLDARLPRGGVRRALAALAVVVALAAAIQLALPALFPTVLVRFTDPRGDHPPFSLTRLTWAAAPERVRAGAPARGEITVAGRAPAALELCALPGEGPELHVPMLQVGADRYAGELAAVAAPVTVWAVGGGTRTTRRALAIDPVPALAHLDIEADAPAYARLDPDRRRLRADAQATFALLPGSRLLLRPEANRPLAAVVMARTGAGDGELRLPLNDGAAQLDDPPPGAWTVACEAVDGVRGPALPLLRVDARSDQPPRARIVAPAHDALATPAMRIPLVIAADDDLGLVQVVRTGEFNQLAAPEVAVAVDGLSWRRDSVLDLGELGVAPGDLITITVVARDSHPGGGQFSTPERRSIRVISEHDYNRELLRHLGTDALERKYGPLAESLAGLERRMAALDRQRATLPRDQLDHELAQLGREAGELEREIAGLRRPTPLFALEPAAIAKLEQAAKQLREAAERGETQPFAGAGAMMQADLRLLTRLAEAQGLTARLRRLAEAEQNAVQRFEPLAEHRRLTDAERVRLRELGDQEDQLAAAVDKWSLLAAKVARDLRILASGDDPDATAAAAVAPAAGNSASSADPAALAHASETADKLDTLNNKLADADVSGLKRKSAAAARAGDGGGALHLASAARDRLLELLVQTMAADDAANDEACSGLGWGDGGSIADTLGGLGGTGGFGLGGAGSGGLGSFLGYGGDDLGGSTPADTMDLYGPENLGELAGQGAGNGGEDGLAAIAAQGAGPPAQAPAYQRQLRGGTVAARTSLNAEQQRLVDDYFRQLEGTTP